MSYCNVWMCACAHTRTWRESLRFLKQLKRSLCFNKLRTTSVAVMSYRTCFTMLNEILKVNG